MVGWSQPQRFNMRDTLLLDAITQLRYLRKQFESQLDDETISGIDYTLERAMTRVGILHLPLDEQANVYSNLQWGCAIPGKISDLNLAQLTWVKNNDSNLNQLQEDAIDYFIETKS